MFTEKFSCAILIPVIESRRSTKFLMPPSRLAAFCEKFIQASWLVALIVAPLYFNIYSSRVFEPDKIALIRTLALAMGAMWLVLRTERWRRRNTLSEDALFSTRVRAWLASISRENPLTLPALFLLIAYLISTALSLSPIVSFFGSYQRLQGLYTFSSYLVIFFLAASQIKSRADIDRAITIALIVSFPIAFYGIIQHYFLDPLPWIGDVTARVASNLGNSIFIGSFLILTVPLALARLIQTTERAAATRRARLLLYAAIIATFLVVAGAWGSAFELGAKPLIETNFTGTLTAEQLALASSAFNLALATTLAVVVVWLGAAFLFKLRAVIIVLIAAYTILLAIQLIALFFSQSRGPLLGLLGGMFTFGVLFAVIRGAHKFALGIVSAAALVVILLALINIPNSPLSFLRALPYVGRMGRVFELEGGTGRVRVLIWQGALKLVVPHESLWSPLTGEDSVNVIRPLVGYGPETMYVAYNKFYPPELGTLESRNATPDRSHNETFDALVTTGLAGFVAENVLFLSIFYLALRWLGLMPSPRARNLFITAWFGGGSVLAIAFGLTLGWEFIGVALPGGMILGMFIYLVALTLRGSTRSVWNEPSHSLWLVALTALFVSHFIEIHFGIAIVTTRVYFWFFAAVFVALGTRRIAMQESAVPVESREQPVQKNLNPTAPPAKRKRAAQNAPIMPRREVSSTRRAPDLAHKVSTAPLITFAFLVGFILAVMAFDYINTNNVGVLGSPSVSGLDIIISALTIKQTTTGGMTSLAMLWLFVATLLIGLGVCAGEWGSPFRLGARDWIVAGILFVVLAFAIFSGLAFYHVLLIATVGAEILDALLAAVVLLTVFMLLIVTICAITLLFDDTRSMPWMIRTTNAVVLPILLIIAFVLIFSTNIEPIRADMLYKQAASITGSDNARAIALLQRALQLQPQQDYYDLFLGRAYLDAAKAAADPSKQGEYLRLAQDALEQARAINPYNTDHSANLARLAQARAGLASDLAGKIDAYKQAAEYFDQANRLSPNTAHLYDQHAQVLLEYAGVLQANGQNADAVRDAARQQLERATETDPTFCLTYAVRAQAQTNWRDRVTDALKAIDLAPQCGDVFYGEGLSLAVNELAHASDEAGAANANDEFAKMMTDAAAKNPTLEIYTTLANFYSRTGRVSEAITATDNALSKIPESDTTTRKRYEDFRFTLVALQNALNAANASPKDAELQRAVAQQWLARGQINFALPAFQKVIELKPDDYPARRTVALLLISADQLDAAQEQVDLAQKIAPASDAQFWTQLAAVLQDIQNQRLNEAVPILQELAQSANTQDFALMKALETLTTKVKGAG